MDLTKAKEFLEARGAEQGLAALLEEYRIWYTKPVRPNIKAYITSTGLDKQGWDIKTHAVRMYLAAYMSVKLGMPAEDVGIEMKRNRTSIIRMLVKFCQIGNTREQRTMRSEVAALFPMNVPAAMRQIKKKHSQS